MSADARDFNNMKTRAVTNLFFLQGWVPKEIHAILTVTLQEHAPSCATVKNWVTQLKRGDFSTCVVPCPRRPKIVTITEIIDEIHQLILQHCPISAKSIAEQLGISHERVGSTIHEDLGMRKLSAKWVLKCPKADQGCQQCQSSEQLWNCLDALQNGFLPRLMTMDETWLYPYDPETKQQSMEWRHSASPRPQKNSKFKNPLQYFSPRFLGSRPHPPNLLSPTVPNYQRGKLLTSAG